MTGIFIAASVLALVWLGLALLHGYQDGMDLSWRPFAYAVAGVLVFGGLFAAILPGGAR